MLQPFPVFLGWTSTKQLMKCLAQKTPPARSLDLFDLILYVPSTIFQLNRDGSSWVEPVLSKDKCVLLKGHNKVTPERLEPAAPRSRVKHSTTEPLSSQCIIVKKKTKNWFSRPIIAWCRSKVLQNAPKEHSAIFSTFIKLPFMFKDIGLSIFEWPLKAGFTVIHWLLN